MKKMSNLRHFLSFFYSLEMHFYITLIYLLQKKTMHELLYFQLKFHKN